MTDIKKPDHVIRLEKMEEENAKRLAGVVARMKPEHVIQQEKLRGAVIGILAVINTGLINGEPVMAVNWAKDFRVMEYRVDGELNYRSVRLEVDVDGVAVLIDTGRRHVRSKDENNQINAPFDADMVGLDDYFRDKWNDLIK